MFQNILEENFQNQLDKVLTITDFRKFQQGLEDNSFTEEPITNGWIEKNLQTKMDNLLVFHWKEMFQANKLIMELNATEQSRVQNLLDISIEEKYEFKKRRQNILNRFRH